MERLVAQNVMHAGLRHMISVTVGAGGGQEGGSGGWDRWMEQVGGTGGWDRWEDR